MPDDGSTQPMYLEQLTYESMPWNTHPIDIAHGSQGWGPMAGPYSPVDYAAPAMAGMGGEGIDIYWTQGNNNIHFAPPYAVKTVFEDPSQSFVNNSHYMSSLVPAPAKGSATIQQGSGQGIVPTAKGKSALLLSALRSALGMQV